MEEGDRIKALKDPYLLVNIVKEVQKEKVQGNAKAILVLVNKICIRLVQGARAESSNLVVSDKYGGGKDKVTSAVCCVMLGRQHLIHRTSLSKKALLYFGTSEELEDDFSWHNKVLYIEDPDEELLKSQVFRTMASGGTEASTVSEGRLVNLIIEGKPTIIVTSFRANIDREGERRWDGLRVDTTRELTKDVTKDALDAFAGNKILKKPDFDLRNALHSNLQSYDVIFPDAPVLHQYITTVLKSRTSIHNLIDHIKASAILNQFQRKKDELGRLVATWFDYAYGKFVYEQLNRKEGTMLNLDEQAIVNALRKEGPLPIAMLANHIPRTKQWIYNNLDNLKSREIIRVEEIPSEYANWNIVQMISLGTKAEPFKLPGYSEINKIKEGLNTKFIGEIKEINKFIDIENILLINKDSKEALNPLNILSSPCTDDLNPIEKPLNPDI